MTQPPNILFLMSDEHRADVAGFAGNPVVRTPTLDALAADGVVFTNAYTPSPICVPARQALAAGKLPRHCGCETFGQDLAPGSLTFARHLARHGYRTVCCGKLHHEGPDQMQGWTERPAGDLSVGNGFIDGRVEPMFTQFAKRPVDHKWSMAKEIQRAGIGKGPYHYADELAVEAACITLREHFVSPIYDRALSERPLLLKVSLVQPHYPLFTDEAKFTHYLNRVPVYHQEPPLEHPALNRWRVRIGTDISAHEARRATAAYYGMIETLDAHFARVLDMLRAVGQDPDQWLILYTSDHGDMLGQHGVWEKTQFFEGSVRVPLIIRWPRKFGPGRVNRNVNLCDLFATLADSAGLPIPDGLDSRNLTPLLRGDTAAWDARHPHDETVSQFGGRRHNELMIKRGPLKYQSYGTHGPEVLFDLQSDLNETRNLIAEPAFRPAVEAFRQRRAELGYAPAQTS